MRVETCGKWPRRARGRRRGAAGRGRGAAGGGGGGMPGVRLHCMYESEPSWQRRLTHVHPFIEVSLAQRLASVRRGIGQVTDGTTCVRACVRARVCAARSIVIVVVADVVAIVIVAVRTTFSSVAIVAVIVTMSSSSSNSSRRISSNNNASAAAAAAAAAASPPPPPPPQSHHAHAPAPAISSIRSIACVA